jgi:hypothetical protein
MMRRQRDIEEFKEPMIGYEGYIGGLVYIMT